jgi:hypothetical protein
VAAAATLGQGLIIEGFRAVGWATTGLALLLIPLAIYLPFVPSAASGLTRTLGDPALYAGPAAWLTGCCPAAEMVEKEVLVTQIVEKEGEQVVVTVISEPTMVVEEASATEAPPEPTASPAEAPTALPGTEMPIPTSPPEPTATAIPLPTEPYPLRQVFPETLYWDPEAVTDEDGSLAIDLPLADTITTWRLTALASTQNGELGATTHDIVVFQDFFLQLDAPEVITQSETVTVTVTLYNYLPDAQIIRVEPQPADWFAFEAPPEQVVVPANGVAAVQFAIRPQQAGVFPLAVTARGEGMVDGVAVDVTVVETP